MQILPVGMSMHAERYTYLPYLGLFFLMASGYSNLSNHQFWLKSKPHFATLLTLVIIIFALITFNRTKVWNSSESLWLDVIKKYPYNFVAYVNITNHYIFEEQLDKAIEYADRGILTVGHNVYFYDNKSYSLLMAQKYQEALKVIETAKKLVQPDAQLFVNEGDSYLGLNLPDQAIASYTQALQIDHGHPTALIKRANIYLNNLKDTETSIRDLLIVLRSKPKNIDALTSLAAAYHQAQQPQEAISTIDKAIALDPENQALQDLKPAFGTR
ncbi:MAG: hypothetical protein IPL46_22180 [Saprospiraceae bacterium]|nr:hypothetical protein [Saprospiraceae bacterium]